MAEHKQPPQPAASQHQAHPQQDSEQPQDLGLLRQAYLRHQAALVAVQDLERQRLNQQ